MPGQYIPLQELKSTAHMSPLSVRTSRIQDTTFSSSQDPDESVVKISSMFPTVTDTHIRLLLKKYHNREAVVISALQVEKHPIVTLGPFATPPPTRSVHGPLQMTPPLGVRTVSRTSSPILRTYSGTNSTYTGSPRIGDGYRNSPRPHSSPKLKLRYMKSIFPEVEETMILDILSSNENNIQKASDSLKQMGFVKQDPAKLKLEAEVKAKEEQRKIQEEIDKVDSPPPIPKIKTTEEKQVIQESLQNHYKDVPEHVIVMALDSVDYNEETAIQILEIMVKGDNKMKENGKKVEEVLVEKAEEEGDFLTVPNSVPTSQSRQSLKSLLKEKAENPKITFSRVIEENNMSNANEFKSVSLSNTNGSNPEYAKGANEKLLLEDYVKWQGPNPKLYNGCNKSLAKGPNKSLLSKGSYKACGANPDMHKGPMFGLAKGSIFSQLKHVVLGESRGQ